MSSYMVTTHMLWLLAMFNILFFVCVLILFPFSQYGAHSKKRPNNLVIGRTYDHHIYDLIEVGVENFKTMESFSYDKKLAPRVGSKPFFAFMGEGFESVEELRHLKEVLLDLFRGEVIFLLPSHFPLLLLILLIVKGNVLKSRKLIYVGCWEFKSCRCRPSICMYSYFLKYSVLYTLCSETEKIRYNCPKDGAGWSWPLHGFGSSTPSAS